MSMKDALIERITATSSVEIKYRINRGKYSNHLFFEGKTDKLFYIDMMEKCSIHIDRFAIYECGKRDNVIFAASNLPRYADERCAFFVDHDEVPPVSVSDDVYVTGCYSFENYLVSKKSFLYLLKRNCGVTSQEDVNRYLSIFERFQFSSFVVLRRIMRLKRYLLSCGQGRSWDKIDLNYFCDIRADGRVVTVKDKCRAAKVLTAFDTQKYLNVNSDGKKLTNCNEVYGKGLLKLFLSLIDNACRMAKDEGKEPIFIKDKSNENATMILAPLCDPPADLVRFFTSRCT